MGVMKDLDRRAREWADEVLDLPKAAWELDKDSFIRELRERLIRGYMDVSMDRGILTSALKKSLIAFSAMILTNRNS